jgi:hypothetical protein
MILHDLFDWTNSGVGVAGLALTVGAVWQATGAKKAAEEAKEAIWQRDASDSFSELGKLAGELVQLLQLQRPNEAAVRVRDLLALIPRNRARFERFIAGDTDRLKAMESMFQKLAVQLSAPSFMEKKDELEAAIGAVLEANRDLSTVHGRLLSRLDRE